MLAVWTLVCFAKREVFFFQSWKAPEIRRLHLRKPGEALRPKSTISISGCRQAPLSPLSHFLSLSLSHCLVSSLSQLSKFHLLSFYPVGVGASAASAVLRRSLQCKSERRRRRRCRRRRRRRRRRGLAAEAATAARFDSFGPGASWRLERPSVRVCVCQSERESVCVFGSKREQVRERERASLYLEVLSFSITLVNLFTCWCSIKLPTPTPSRPTNWPSPSREFLTVLSQSSKNVSTVIRSYNWANKKSPGKWTDRSPTWTGFESRSKSPPSSGFCFQLSSDGENHWPVLCLQT